MYFIFYIIKKHKYFILKLPHKERNQKELKSSIILALTHLIECSQSI